MATRCDQALNYAQQGFPVFPIQPGLKIPYPGSKGLHDATVDPDQVKAWWERYPDANIGLRTGEVSGITVVDFDVKSGGLESFASWPQPVLTFQVETPGGGRHLYYKYEPSLRQTTGLRPGVDVRNDGGYVLAPGSVVGGKEYRVVVKASFSELPAGVLRSSVSGSPASGSLASGSKATDPSAARGGSGELGGILEGGRNASITRIAGALRKQGVSEGGMEQALLAINEVECDPPLSDREVRTIAKSVSRYTPEPDAIPSSTVMTALEMLDRMVATLEDKAKRCGEPTGFDKLDECLGGGARLGELIAVHAQAKTGKNVFIHKWMLNYLQRGIPVGYASREMRPAEEVVPELLSKVLKKNLWVDSFSKEEVKAACEDWPLYFSHGQGFFPIEQLRLWVQNLRDNYGVRYFFLDHLHYALPKEEWQLAAELIRVLKAMANDLEICFVVIIQPTNPKEGGGLGLHTMKGGSSIGQAIDAQICMERVPGESVVSCLKVAAVRHRLGQKWSSEKDTIYLRYDRYTTDLEEGEYTPHTQEQKQAPPKLVNPFVAWDSEAMQVE